MHLVLSVCAVYTDVYCIICIYIYINASSNKAGIEIKGQFVGFGAMFGLLKTQIDLTLANGH